MHSTLINHPAVTEDLAQSAGRSEGQVPEYSIHLDAVRGVAAVVVFLGHLRLFFLPSLTQALRHGMGPPPAAGSTSAQPPVHSIRSFDLAHEAVMIFFVLSGYLVGGGVIRMFRQRRWSWKRYLIHRMVRLWMVLLPVLVLGLAVDMAGAHHFAGQGTVYTTGPGGLPWEPALAARIRPNVFLGNIFFLQEIRVPPLGTNQPLWSLANEFWYYLAFPCFVLAIAGVHAVWKRLVALVALGTILWFVGSQVSLYSIIWLLGALVAFLPLRIAPRFRGLCTGVSLLLFPGALALARKIDFGAIFVDLTVAIAFAVMLYCLVHFTELSRPGVYGHSARFLSRISYSLYLVHAPVLCLMSAALVGSNQTLPLNGHSALLLGEVVAVVLAATCSVHFLFEARTDRVRRFLEARL